MNQAPSTSLSGSPPGFMPNFAEIRLNEAFCFKHAVVPIEWRDGGVTVGMADTGDKHTIAALRFATGSEILPVEMAAEEIRSRLEALSCRQLDPAAHGVVRSEPRPGSRGQSLSDLVASRRHARTGCPAGLGIFRLLLAGGYTPVEAGEVILAANSGRRTGDVASVAVAARLRGGHSLSEALASVGAVPFWLRQTLHQLPPEAHQPTVLADLLECESTFAVRRAAVAWLMAEIAILAGLLAYIWSTISVPFAALIAIAGVVALYRLRPDARSGPDKQFLRANVIAIVASLARGHLPPALAIRCGLERLQAIAPTWGNIPESRKSLANALDLDPLATAILLRGDLRIAADCAAQECTMSGLRVVDTCRRATRLSGIALFLLAIGIIVSR